MFHHCFLLRGIGVPVQYSIQCNLDVTKGQGTGKICSLKGGFVLLRFFFIYFTVTRVKIIMHYILRTSLYRGFSQLFWNKGDEKANDFKIRINVTSIKLISKYTLSDLDDLSNLIGSLSQTIQQYSPPSEWIMCELCVFPIFLENDLLKVDKILGLTFFKARKDLEGFNTAFYNLL